MKRIYILIVLTLLFLTGKDVYAGKLSLTEDFSSINDSFTYNGTAYRDGALGEAVLTVPCCGYAGSIFYEEPVNTGHFNASFDFRIEQVDIDGADGFTFAVIDSLNPNYLGRGGGGLGYKGEIGGFAIEFDTHKNNTGDLNSYNHIGVNVDGSVYSVYINRNVPEFEDNGTFHTEVSVRGGNKLEVYLENQSIGYPRTKVVDYKIEGMKPFKGLVGFTGGLGAFRDIFYIDNFVLQHQPL